MEWRRRAEAFTFWQDRDTCDPRPYINFQLDAWITQTQPFQYYASNDTNRWRSLYFHLEISKRVFILSIPFKRLPDHVPSERQMRLRK